MSPEAVETVKPSQSVKDLAERMRIRGIGYFPVTDRGRLVGVVTDRDITCRVVAEDREPRTTKVRDIMVKGIAYCFDDDDLNAAIQLMEQNRVRRLPVMDRAERLIGILSLSDIAQHVPGRLTAEILRTVSRPVPLSVTVSPSGDLLR